MNKKVFNYRTLALALRSISDACLRAWEQQQNGERVTACAMTADELEFLCEDYLPNLMNPMMSTEEVKERLHVSDATLNRMVARGDLNIVQQLKDCCCTTQQNIVKMGYESQLGQKDIVNTIQTQTLAMQQGHNNITTEILRNLATITAQNQQDKCDILRSGEMNTQRIVDVLNQHWQSDLQQRYNDARLELSQQRQNAELIAALKTTTTTTTT